VQLAELVLARAHEHETHEAGGLRVGHRHRRAVAGQEGVGQRVERRHVPEDRRGHGIAQPLGRILPREVHREPFVIPARQVRVARQDRQQQVRDLMPHGLTHLERVLPGRQVDDRAPLGRKREPGDPRLGRLVLPPTAQRAPVRGLRPDEVDPELQAVELPQVTAERVRQLPRHLVRRVAPDPFERPGAPLLDVIRRDRDRERGGRDFERKYSNINDK